MSIRIISAIATLLLACLLAAACSNSSSGGTMPECGNGDLEGTEECDDGNALSCDGCSSACLLETGYVCGDGILNQTCGEECDDGNIVPGDGCDANCVSELCGDGTQDAGEECDDGNTTSCDGCSASCKTEVGFICGDGILNLGCGEECDDGNLVPGDGCDASCQAEGPVQDIGGEYAIDVDTTVDSCGFGSGSSSTPMEVVETTQTSVTVNIPIGGAGGACNRENFDRQLNTVTRTESSQQSIGACTVLVEAQTSLTFFADDTVTGLETNMLSAIGGDCSGLVLPCEIRLVMSGARCSGCFNCVTPSRWASEPGLGVLGSGNGVTLDVLRNRVNEAKPGRSPSL